MQARITNHTTELISLLKKNETTRFLEKLKKLSNEDFDSYKVLQQAAIEGNHVAALYLQQRKVPLDLEDEVSSLGSPLFLAIKFGHDFLAQQLYNGGASKEIALECCANQEDRREDTQEISSKIRALKLDVDMWCGMMYFATEKFSDDLSFIEKLCSRLSLSEEVAIEEVGAEESHQQLLPLRHSHSETIPVSHVRKDINSLIVSAEGKTILRNYLLRLLNYKISNEVLNLKIQLQQVSLDSLLEGAIGSGNRRFLMYYLYAKDQQLFDLLNRNFDLCDRVLRVLWPAANYQRRGLLIQILSFQINSEEKNVDVIRRQDSLMRSQGLTKDVVMQLYFDYHYRSSNPRFIQEKLPQLDYFQHLKLSECLERFGVDINAPDVVDIINSDQQYLDNIRQKLLLIESFGETIESIIRLRPHFENRKYFEESWRSLIAMILLLALLVYAIYLDGTFKNENISIADSATDECVSKIEKRFFGNYICSEYVKPCLNLCYQLLYSASKRTMVDWLGIGFNCVIEFIVMIDLVLRNRNVYRNGQTRFDSNLLRGFSPELGEAIYNLNQQFSSRLLVSDEQLAVDDSDERKTPVDAPLLSSASQQVVVSVSRKNIIFDDDTTVGEAKQIMTKTRDVLLKGLARLSLHAKPAEPSRVVQAFDVEDVEVGLRAK